MQYFIDIVSMALAADAIATAWFYGSIFKPAREYLENKGGLFGELVGCPLCLAFHICFWLMVFFWLPMQALPVWLGWFPRLIIYSLAITDVVHWLQGVRPIPEEDENDTDGS